jgi:predicted enzyme related to lactoylglutathione lyase
MGDDRWVTVAPTGNATAFTLSKRDADTPKRPDDMSGVIMEVDDVYQTCDELTKRGVQFTDAPRTEPWGGWAMFKDSEGNVHGLHSPARAPVSSN